MNILKRKDFEQQAGESNKAYRIRLYKNKDLYGLNNYEIGQLCNKAFGVDWDESAHRKKVKNYLEGYSDAIMEYSKNGSAEVLEEIKSAERKFEQEKIKYRDERNSWNRQNYLSARVEHKLDCLEKAIIKNGEERYKPIDYKSFNLDSHGNDLLVCLSDLHIGSQFDSAIGKYNSDIAKERLKKYLAEIIEIKSRHGSENCVVMCLGDMISGNIHKSIAVTNRENVIEQIRLASIMISDFCYELCNVFSNVTFLSVSGNHSRIDTKEEALHDERLEDLIEFFVENSLLHINNFSVCHDKVDNSLKKCNIRGLAYYGCHGDFDDFSKKGLSSLILMTHEIPCAIMFGHKHFPASTQISNVNLIQSGCLCGSGDDYTLEKRLSNKPSQTVCVCSAKGIEAIYPVMLG